MKKPRIDFTRNIKTFDWIIVEETDTIENIKNKNA
jgi:hypothetical protein